MSLLNLQFNVGKSSFSSSDYTLVEPRTHREKYLSCIYMGKDLISKLQQYIKLQSWSSLSIQLFNESLFLIMKFIAPSSLILKKMVINRFFKPNSVGSHHFAVEGFYR